MQLPRVVTSFGQDPSQQHSYSFSPTRFKALRHGEFTANVSILKLEPPRAPTHSVKTKMRLNWPFMSKRAILVGASLLFLLLVGSLYLARPSIAVFLRHRIRIIVEAGLKGQVEFSDFRVTFKPTLSVTVTDFRLRHHGRTDVPPLIQISEIVMTPRLDTLFGKRFRVASVTLTGLHITFPPREPGSPPLLRGTKTDLKSKYSAVVESLQATDGTITILRGDPQKPPLEFPIHNLELQDLRFDGAARFRSTLTNAVPQGEINTTGSFGPWNGETPRETPVHGEYTFEHADLGTIRGLQGILFSKGSFRGPLDYLDVEGSTDTPDFTLRKVANPLALHTDFLATVDGTNGDTYLHSVAARFLNSKLTVKGRVVDLDRSVRSRTIDLDAYSSDARAEDLIRLAARTDRPVLTGVTQLTAKIRIPEGNEDLSDRLQVYAKFQLGEGQFSDPALQTKVDSLSRKGQGEPRDMSIAHVPSRLAADMVAKKGVVNFAKIRFDVPGANLDIRGAYTIDGGALAFHGNLFLDAKLSHTTTGLKSFLLKAVDPFFSDNNGGTRLPVKILGTKDHPQFGLDRGGSRQTSSPHAGLNRPT